MASPVFHALAGGGLAFFLASRWRRRPEPLVSRPWGPAVAGALWACLPDVDYLPGWLSGDLNRFHQQITHSLLWVALAAGGLWLAGRCVRPAQFGGRTALLLLLVIGSHLAVDLVTMDRRPPVGIPLYWPLSARPVHGPLVLLPAWRKSTVADLFHAENLRPLGIELAAGLVILAASVAGSRSWTRQKSAL